MNPSQCSEKQLTAIFLLLQVRKNPGKSHLSKILVSSLVANGAVVIIFDLNNEYEGLGMNKDGLKNQLSDRIVALEPGRTLKFALDYLGEFSLVSLMQHVLDSPSASLREFVRIIQALEHTEKYNMEGLAEAIQNWRGNELVKDALYSRYQTMKNSGVFARTRDEGVRVDDLIKSLLPRGGAVVISLKRASALTKKMVVEIVLSKARPAAGKGDYSASFPLRRGSAPVP